MDDSRRESVMRTLVAEISRRGPWSDKRSGRWTVSHLRRRASRGKEAQKDKKKKKRCCPRCAGKLCGDNGCGDVCGLSCGPSAGCCQSLCCDHPKVCCQGICQYLDGSPACCRAVGEFCSNDGNTTFGPKHCCSQKCDTGLGHTNGCIE